MDGYFSAWKSNGFSDIALFDSFASTQYNCNMSTNTLRQRDKNQTRDAKKSLKSRYLFEFSTKVCWAI